MKELFFWAFVIGYGGFPFWLMLLEWRDCRRQDRALAEFRRRTGTVAKP